MSETTNQLYNNILNIVKEYSSAEETYGDAAQLRIDPKSLEVSLIEDPDEDLVNFDYYELGDLIMPQTDGSFLPDEDAIKEIAADY